jgi:phospholipid/cholesterol/gamma-HCH transport system substrate-binding protein
MKMSKEVRIGILVTLSILIFFIGFNFLKNATVFSNEKEYYCFYKNIGGLQNSAVVQIMGLNVGHVSGMELVDGKGVKVAISIGKKVNLPVGTVAKLESVLLGTPSINLELGKGPGIVQPGSELTSDIEGGFVDNLSAELTPRLRELKPTITAFDSTLADVNAIVGAENQKEIAAAIHSINNAAKNIELLSGTLNEESKEMTDILHNLRSFTGSLASQNDTIKHILINFNNISKQLANSPIQKTMTELHTTVSQLNDVAQKINKGEGSLGLLVNDKELYNNFKTSLITLNKLLADINAHPSKYINVNIIGGKKKDQ